ncbi:MAG: rhodanese-like domain-containing protein [Chloroflexota bacterium]
MPKKTKRGTNNRNSVSNFMKRPAVQFGTLAVIVLIIVLIALNGRGAETGTSAAEISVDQAYEMYQNGTFVLDVRTQEEWDEYHAPNTTLIPLDQLQSRLNELPKDQPIVVVCRSGNRSQQGRDILLAAGYDATSMAGGLKEWSAKGYPIDGTRP